MSIRAKTFYKQRGPKCGFISRRKTATVLLAMTVKRLFQVRRETPAMCQQYLSTPYELKFQGHLALCTSVVYQAAHLLQKVNVL